MLFSELYKIVANKVTFAGFMSDHPNRPPPPDPPLLSQAFSLEYYDLPFNYKLLHLIQDQQSEKTFFSNLL